ncbi:MAG: bifunctional phosphoribosyl-AMP cyclohydrolase/phosphoribosyl-ATP diphosphatase HisIE [Clostridiales bacterium]|jgi:phosphoribosyl-ATP pyrophosphohydrolase/phosphoribosyl-AMP cyclohydrolase|nr:bifunctional phosphoribosyl-AMP cyclohydrolase/phosphoribosyl-ATP diphosphatase HisIE [Clostridiales bacterium]
MMDLLNKLKFDENGLMPAIIQDVESGRVLMLAYMNKEAVEKSMKTGKTHFWSRSRNKLWMKGETSGHIQLIQEAYFDCDRDALLFKVRQTRAACHTGNYSCFFNKINDEYDIITEHDQVFQPEDVYQNKAAILKKLYDVVADRKLNPKDGSYTNYLFDKGLDKILKKIGEEASEVIIASKNRSKEEVVYETADLIYHLMVLLVEQGVTLDDIYDELRKRS